MVGLKHDVYINVGRFCGTFVDVCFVALKKYIHYLRGEGPGSMEYIQVTPA